MLSSKMWPADEFAICDVRARDIRIWQINFGTFLRWQKKEEEENKSVQGVPQSQTTVPTRGKEEKKMTKTNTYKQMHEKHTDQLPFLQSRWSQY